MGQVSGATSGNSVTARCSIPSRLARLLSQGQGSCRVRSESQEVERINWAPLRGIIEDNKSFLISSHVRPDADALGSELGMAAILKAFDREVLIVNATSPPANLQFLNADEAIRKLNEDIAADDLPAADVHIVVDTSAWQQLGAMASVIQKSGAKRVVIDHHVSSDNMGATEFKDVNSPSTGQLIY